MDPGDKVIEVRENNSQDKKRKFEQAAGMCKAQS